MDTILISLLLTYLVVQLYKKYPFENAAYKESNVDTFLRTITDPGRKGEFLIYTNLEGLDEQNRLLTNVSLPKQDGTTAEIDLIMIAATGIYVFDSKNYNGFIFGDEGSRYWTQSLKCGHAYQFYNPVWQNKKHISTLQHHLNMDNEVFRSYIIFSERCVLQEMAIYSPKVKVMKLGLLSGEVAQDMAELPDLLSIWEINQIYNELARYTLADGATK